jgi:hypothetical protein
MDRLATYERKSVVKFIKDENSAGIGYNLALGGALLVAHVGQPIERACPKAIGRRRSR